MRFISLLIYITLSIQALAQDPFLVPREEIGKTGVYTIEQPGVPKHKDYEEIYRHNHGRKLKKDPTGKFFLLQHQKAKFNLIIPESYNPGNPPGIIFLDVRPYRLDDTFSKDASNFIKDYCKQKNFICIQVAGVQPLAGSGLDAKHESPILVRRAIDIVKERYKTDNERILLYCSSSVDSTFIAVICCPHIFKYNAFIGTPMFFYDNMKNFQGKKIASFGAQGEAITTMKEASKNKYVFYHMFLSDDVNLIKQQKDIDKKGEEVFVRNKFNKTEFIDVTIKGLMKNPANLAGKLAFEHQHNLMLSALDKIDPKPFDAKSFLTQAQLFEKKKNFPKAFEAYKTAAKYGFEEAIIKSNEMKKELTETVLDINKYDKSKNYPEAFRLAQYLLKKFGSKSSLRATLINKSYLKDKKIVLEIKAAAFLSKAEAALKQNPPPKDKIKAACEKVIKTVPGTFTAKKAKDIIEKLK